MPNAKSKLSNIKLHPATMINRKTKQEVTKEAKDGSSEEKRTGPG